MEKKFKHLIPGKRDSIIETFGDNDGKIHPPGGIYTLTGSGFLSYGDGLTLRFRQTSEPEAMCLQWREEAQMEIIKSLEDYLVGVV